jgi:hypothetical protein
MDVIVPQAYMALQSKEYSQNCSVSSATSINIVVNQLQKKKPSQNSRALNIN